MWCGNGFIYAYLICLKYGMTRPEDVQTKEKICGLVNEFVDIFKSRNGSIILLHKTILLR